MNKLEMVEIHVIGDQNGESVTAMGKQAQLLLEDLTKQHKRRLILDDLSQMGRTDTPARQMVSKLARSLDYDKTAMVGPNNTLMKQGTRLLLTAIGLGRKIRYFVDRETAIRWLQAP